MGGVAILLFIASYHGFRASLIGDRSSLSFFTSNVFFPWGHIKLSLFLEISFINWLWSVWSVNFWNLVSTFMLMFCISSMEWLKLLRSGSASLYVSKSDLSVFSSCESVTSFITFDFERGDYSYFLLSASYPSFFIPWVDFPSLLFFDGEACVLDVSIWVTIAWPRFADFTLSMERLISRTVFPWGCSLNLRGLLMN